MMDKLAVLKKVSAGAAVLCLPLWALSYTTGVAIFQNEYLRFPEGDWLGRLLVGYCTFGILLLITLLVIGCLMRRRKVAAVLCVAGLMIFAGTAALSVDGVVTLHNLHFKPFEQLVGKYWDDDKLEVDLWLGRDEAGEDIWMAVPPEGFTSIGELLARFDCYREPLHPGVADELAALDLTQPAWHFRIRYEDDDLLMVACEENLCVLSANGEPPTAYEVRPTFYDGWSGYVMGDFSWEYEYLRKKYAE